MKNRFSSLLRIVFILLFTVPVNAFAVRGDTNCDLAINFDDIDPFIKALSGQAAYQAAYPNCVWLNADVNNSGSVNFDDIDPFIALLSSCGSNQPPVANAGPDKTGHPGETLTFNGGGSSDPDGASGNLSYNWQFGDSTSAQGMTVTHSYNQPGTYVVSLSVRDPCGAEATDAVSVNIVSQAAQVPPRAIILRVLATYAWPSRSFCSSSV